MIREAAPNAVEDIQYGMISYAQGEMLCALASQKNHMTLYVCDPPVVDAHRVGLGKLNCGKGCIRFKRLDDLPLEVVRDILREAAQRRQVLRLHAQVPLADTHRRVSGGFQRLRQRRFRR